MEHNFSVKTISNKDEYEGLRTLWCEVFSDEPNFVDAMYANFGEDIAGYVAADEEGRICSALTRFKCGTFEGKDVYTSYAICTAKEMRGLGLAGRLVETARDDVLNKGGISLISPAEPSLENFYGAHGYVPFFFADKNLAQEDEEDFIFDAEDEEYEKFEAKTVLKDLKYDEYNEYREHFLEGIPHVKLNEHMMRLVQAWQKRNALSMLLRPVQEVFCSLQSRIRAAITGAFFQTVLRRNMNMIPPITQTRISRR